MKLKDLLIIIFLNVLYFYTQTRVEGSIFQYLIKGWAIGILDGIAIEVLK